MHRNHSACTLFALALLLALGACSSSGTEPAGDLQLGLEPVASGLASPVYLTAPAGDGRLFVVEQPGRIRIVKNGQLLTAPFLDITSRVSYGGERGLLSMAFDPQYAANGFFYVYYTSVPNGDIVVERYGGTAGADVANATPTPVITIPHPGAANHNGGLVTFGPDGMLLMGTGDGGGAGDPNGNGQNVTVLLGKLLRLDVHTLPYTIPPSNPFAGRTDGVRPEIWAYGLRNPWRFAFDRLSNPAVLYIADVGQDAWEEVDIVGADWAGQNYMWNAFEGRHCYPASVTNCTFAGNTARLPIYEYPHTQGRCSITGGFVYRGAAIPELAGQYFYADYCTGEIASLTGVTAETVGSHTWNVGNPGSVTSFGEDAARELYVLSASGTVSRIVKL